ncbi:MAG TPA: hypothetical protein VJS92_01030 [Candidatus Polarisedimenticolaceae bacterium]|nr:hypothetical protein [Candidatus Polarisedimenticolaceae bacterium]
MLAGLAVLATAEGLLGLAKIHASFTGPWWRLGSTVLVVGGIALGVEAMAEKIFDADRVTDPLFLRAGRLTALLSLWGLFLGVLVGVGRLL